MFVFVRGWLLRCGPCLIAMLGPAQDEELQSRLARMDPAEREEYQRVGLVLV